MLPTHAPGGHFAGASEGQAVVRSHLSAMGHSAARRLSVAKALSGGGGGGNGVTLPSAAGAPGPGSFAPPGPPGGMTNPGGMAPPVAMGGMTPPGAAPPNLGGKVPGQHNFRAAISMAAGHHGVSAGPGEIHQAIDSLTQAGRFTPTQGALLKSHQGPLVGAAGMNTMRAITHNLVSGDMGAGSIMGR